MNNTTLKKIRYAGIAMQIPKSWKAESAEYDDPAVTIVTIR